MFAAIYSFKVKKGEEDIFIKSWRSLTELIYEFEGSLGSRLHKQADGLYIAYAQWPSKDIWKNAGQNLPDFADGVKKLMKAACSSIETIHELEMVSDFIQPDVY